MEARYYFREDGLDLGHLEGSWPTLTQMWCFERTKSCLVGIHLCCCSPRLASREIHARHDARARSLALAQLFEPVRVLAGVVAGVGGALGGGTQSIREGPPRRLVIWKLVSICPSSRAGLEVLGILIVLLGLVAHLIVWILVLGCFRALEQRSTILAVPLLWIFGSLYVGVPRGCH